jgi:lipoprotein-anchoring transpeptidase ErfK/SrfK
MRRAVVIPLVLVLVLVGGAAVAVAAYDHARHDLIAPGVRVAGVPVGGLHAPAAQAKVERALARPLARPVVVQAAGRRFTLPAARLHARVDTRALVEQAVAASRHGSILTRTLHGLRGDVVRVDLPVRARYSRRAIRGLAARVTRGLDRAPVDAAVRPAASGLSERAGRPGAAVRRARLVADLAAAAAHPGAARTVRARVVAVRPKVTTADLAARYPAYIVIDRKGFTLRFFAHLRPARTYPIAVGRQGLETPAGLYDVQWKQENPSWYVPNSAWAGKLAGQVIPPGPRDPIKARWMAFNGGAGIHGIDPSEYSSIGHDASHGCVRMRIPDVIDLYDRSPVGTPVFVA